MNWTPQFDVTFDASKLPAFSAALTESLSEAVLKTAYLIEAEAKINAPVDTGALRASIHVKSFFDSGEGSIAEAMKINARAIKQRTKSHVTAALKKRHKPLKPIPDPLRILDGSLLIPESPLEAFVICPVEYAIYQEYGTHKMAAWPFMGPAVESQREKFLERVKTAFIEAGA